ncbi:MAG: hypothetical protein C4K49_00895 [Candidatus Thorarchaeota archaeon]|nr:MAG: hypothetical protein C4K49_00895 [Candidatus Thorarchaeota archaeon]
MVVRFEKHCMFCSASCTPPDDVRGRYVLVSNVWNEERQIHLMFERVARQTWKPMAWVFMDDGSVDGTYDAILRGSRQNRSIPVWVERMPPKTKPNFFTLGRTHEIILGKLRARIDELHVDYMAILDADTEPCPNYFARLCNVLDENPDLGAVSGEPIEEPGSRIAGQPMNSGKLIRWSVVRSIGEYWDFCPDTFYNIKALANGYRLKVMRVPVHLTRPTTSQSPQGVFRQGRLAYYAGRPFAGVLLRSIRRLVLRQHGTEMLRGYLSEVRRGTWRCTDQDVLRFYARDSIPLPRILKTGTIMPRRSTSQHD